MGPKTEQKGGGTPKEKQNILTGQKERDGGENFGKRMNTGNAGS